MEFNTFLTLTSAVMIARIAVICFIVNERCPQLGDSFLPSKFSAFSTFLYIYLILWLDASILRSMVFLYHFVPCLHHCCNDRLSHCGIYLGSLSGFIWTPPELSCDLLHENIVSPNDNQFFPLFQIYWERTLLTKLNTIYLLVLLKLWTFLNFTFDQVRTTIRPLGQVVLLEEGPTSGRALRT